MQKGKLTKDGARRLSRPDLAGKVVVFEKLSIFRNAKNIYYGSTYLGDTISTTGPTPGIKVIK